MEKQIVEEFEPLWNDRETGHFIRASTAALQKWRREGKGPAYIRVGNLIRYRRPDVESWLAARRVHCRESVHTLAKRTVAGDQGANSRHGGIA